MKSVLIDVLKHRTFYFETKIFDDTEEKTEIQTLEEAESMKRVTVYVDSFNFYCSATVPFRRQYESLALSNNSHLPSIKN